MNWNKLLNSGRIRPSEREQDSRNEFESDFGRVIFSPSIRRMHDKTQVFPLTADDHIHSRLTHSMEVMALGHSLGIKVCENKKFQKLIGDRDYFREIPVILKNACLLHDIGNPPFGHFGETVIKTFFLNYFKSSKAIKLTKLQREDFTNFDGNAQGFRIATKLQVLNDTCGLNLTYATLGTFLKYPNPNSINKKQLFLKKRGVFQSERETLLNIGKSCGMLVNNKIVRHPLCFLMEAADSICYLIMDIEDGFNKGWYNFEFVKSKLSSISGISKKIKDLEKRKNGFGDEPTMMVNLRIYLIGRLVKLAADNFIKNIDDICSGTYNAELIENDPTQLVQTLRKFTDENIFPKREITSLELTGHSVLTGLLNYYIHFIFHDNKQYTRRASGLISESLLRVAYLENKLPATSSINDLNDYYKLRIIVDFITGMTDQFAVNHYQKLSGQKIK